MHLGKKTKIILISLALLIMGLWINVINEELVGAHTHRQADTLYTAWSYCHEQTPFLLPKVIFRGMGEGIAIGEFPLWSWFLSTQCQVSQKWNEAFPSWITLLFFFLNGLIWWLWLLRQFNQNKKSFGLSFEIDKKHFWLWAIIYFFSSFNLIHYLIPIPDIFAMTVIGIAALGFQNKNRFIKYTAGFLFLTGFLIRPYLFPLLFVIVFDVNILIWCSGLATLGYYCWYMKWADLSQINYYAIHIEPLKALINQFPHALQTSVNYILHNHWNFILAWPFFLFAKRNAKLFALWLSAFIFIVFMRGHHIEIHNYYLGAISFLGLMMALSGLQFLSPRKIQLVVLVYAMIGIANTQHLYHSNKNNWPVLLQTEADLSGVKAQDKVAVYISFDPSFLYWSKHVGWLKSAEEFRPGQCPAGADWSLILVNNYPQYLPCTIKNGRSTGSISGAGQPPEDDGESVKAILDSRFQNLRSTHLRHGLAKLSNHKHHLLPSHKNGIN